MKKRILVADDEPNIVTALEFMLTRAGYDVAIARNGEEVLRKVAEAAPDLILLDVMMPLLSGYDVCRQLRGRAGGPAMKIVMLSARGRESESQRGLEAGADLYVVKPFSTQELLGRIDSLLRGC